MSDTVDIAWLVQSALDDAARLYPDDPFALYEPSPGQLPGHVAHRVALIVAETLHGWVPPAEHDLTVYQRDDAVRSAERADDRLAQMQADNTRLRETLRVIAGEDYRGPRPESARLAEAALNGR